MPRRYTAREVVRVLFYLGWRVSRQESSHIMLTKQGQAGVVVVPEHLRSTPLDPKTVSSILRQARLTRHEFETSASEVL